MTQPRADKGVDTPTKAPARLTHYAILPAVEIIAVEPAHNADDAVRKWGERQGQDYAGGSYIAVPARSVKLVKVAVETRRQLTLGAP